VTWISLSFWNEKIVLIRGKRREGEAERNYWESCVAVGGLYGMEALFDLT
jgi:putative heme degradation protein